MISTRTKGVVRAVEGTGMGKILIVDDEPDITMVLQTAFEMEGHQVRVANTGRDGLAVLEEGFQPDVVLLDLHMPGIDGPDFLDAARSRGYGRFSVIWMTGAASGPSTLVTDGCDQPVVAKPFELMKLMDMVSQMMEPAPPES